MDTPITKRLHISGLTPALTADDIQQRLSSFGKVLNLDGFGLKDGLGQPRKFGYITLETTTGKLAKCLNLLSGSTWKGTKLRLGDAKPDYAERLRKEREEAEESPRKRYKRNHVVYAQDMSLVTPDIAQAHTGWKVTPLGRVMRPLKMRPPRPLPRVEDSKSTAISKTTVKKKRKRERPAETRARRRTIDMTKWGSTHLKGVLLAAEPVSFTSQPPPRPSEPEVTAKPQINLISPPNTLPLKAAASSIPTTASTDAINLAEEKDQALNFLSSLFGNDESEWTGKESLDSDMEVNESLIQEGDGEGEVTYDIVPKAQASSTVNRKVEPDAETAELTTGQGATVPITLKELFAPTQNIEFSLLSHLNLDLELGDEVPFAVEEISHTIEEAPIPHPLPSIESEQPLRIDNKQALFFPHPIKNLPSTRARAKDVFDLARDNGWYWQDPKVAFYRTDSEDAIRMQWEKKKVELTHAWKKRWKEAGKVSRRRKTGEDAN